MTRRPLVAGNWKMNSSFKDLQFLLEGIKRQESTLKAEMVVFPPFPYLAAAQNVLSNTGISWGAQTVSQYDSGAYTGEVALSMLEELGCRYVIVGHSERRAIFKETNQEVASKFHAALESNITPILCVGETQKQREAGHTLQIIQEQLALALSLHDNPRALSQAVVAYEPVWAIGTGLTATPEQAQEVHAFIRSVLAELDAQLATKTRILYGGSVKPENAASLFAMPDIDGALVGGASLDAEKFIAIGQSCNNYYS